MPEMSEIKQALVELTGSLSSLPDIAGLEPNQYLAIGLLVLVFGRFLIGNPSRRR